MPNLKRRVQNTLMGSTRLYLAGHRWLGVGRFLVRRPHDPDFRYFKRFDGANGLFLDVGANSGSSALSYRLFDRSSCIVSIEPNPTHEADLLMVRRLVGKDFTYHLQAAGAKEDALTLYIPTHRGVSLTGEASLYREEAADNWTAKQLGISPEEIEVDEIEVAVRPIDELGLSPHAVKIDTQGAELTVLEGMPETLERARPVLLIEVSSDTPQIADLLSPLGYEPYWYDSRQDELMPYDGRATANVFFVTPAVPLAPASAEAR